MIENVLIAPTDGNDLGASAHALLEQQKKTWEMLAKGYGSLGSVQTRSIQLDDITIKLQFNPGRIVSTGAKVDPKSIAERKCFLCPANLPPAQRGLLFQDDYVVLCNPFPIFPEHFTIPHKEHVPQRIAASSFETMLDLARAMKGRYTVFYNGPKCGASAPDHLHFQAGDKGIMLVENEFEALKQNHGAVLKDTPATRVFAVAHPLRPFIALESESKAGLCDAIVAVVAAMQEITGSAEEPLMNVLAMHNDGGWRVILFPRARHRPSFYFAEGEQKIMLSPASVDIGGVCVTPIERDFHRITADHLRQMFKECCLSPEQFGTLASKLKAAL